MDEDLIQEKGSVSDEVAIEMAKGIRAISGTDLGLSITAILGTKRGNTNKTCWSCLYCSSFSRKTPKKFNFGGTRMKTKLEPLKQPWRWSEGLFLGSVLIHDTTFLSVQVGSESN